MPGSSPQDTFPAACVLCFALHCCFLKSPSGTQLRALNRSLFDNCCCLASVLLCETSLTGLHSGSCTSRRYFGGSPEVPDVWVRSGQVDLSSCCSREQNKGLKSKSPLFSRKALADQQLPENVIPRLGCRDLSVNIWEAGRALPAAAFPETSLCTQSWDSCSGLNWDTWAGAAAGTPAQTCLVGLGEVKVGWISSPL